jgi:raffinose/stachyose/melibiose transport system permease protein
VGLLEQKGFFDRFIKQGKLGFYALSIVLVIIAIVQVYPLIWLFFFSLKDNSEIFGGNIMGIPQNFLWENYQDAFTKGNVLRYLLNSVIVTTAAIVVSNILGIAASYAIARMKWKLSKITLTIFLLGLMVPIHSSLLPLFMILKQIKLYNTPMALILPYVAYALPMCIFVCVGFLQGIPKELEEAAFIDGCTIYRVFISIITPLLKPAIATVSIFTYLSSWNELMFAVTFISKPEYKTLTVGIMAMAGQYSINWGPIGAGLVIATIPTLIIYIAMSSQVQKSLTTGALKG